MGGIIKSFLPAMILTIVALSLQVSGQLPQYDVKVVATGGAKFVVYDPEGRVVSSHSAQHTAEAAAITASLNNGRKTYFVRQTLELRVTARVPNSTPGEEPELPVDPDPTGLLDPSKLQFVGGYRIPAATDSSGRSMAFSWCGLAFRGNTIWMPHHNGSRSVQEFARPGSRGSDLANIRSWPIAEAGRRVGAYSHLRANFPGYQIFGCHWSPALNRLLVSGRDKYATGPQTADWLIPVNLDNDNPIVEPAIDAEGLTATSFGGGFCNIPQWFADEYTGGNTVGIGLGGYESGQNSSPMPTLAAIGNAPAKIFMLSNFGAPAEHREQRDDNYDSGTLSWGIEPVDGVGYWTSDRVLGTTWVDTPGISSYVALVMQPVGALNYNLQNDTFTTEVQYRLYVYDPADLAKVARGELGPKQVRGRWYSVPSIGSGAPAGMAFDSESQRLNIVYRGGWKQHPTATESYPVVTEFEVVQ